MTDEIIVQEIKKYFSIKELVDKQTFTKHGENAWQFFDIRLLHTLLIIREKLGKPMVINNWHSGGSFSQRGLRTNVCDMVSKKTKAGKLYLSAHTMGKGVDFHINTMDAEEVRMWIKNNEDLFPYKIRLEHKFAKSGKTITWVHLDVFSNSKNPKIYLFNV